MGLFGLQEIFFDISSPVLTTKIVLIVTLLLTLVGFSLKLRAQKAYKKVIHILYTSFEHYQRLNDRINTKTNFKS